MITASTPCPACDQPTMRLVSDVDGSVEYVCTEHGAIEFYEVHQTDGTDVWSDLDEPFTSFAKAKARADEIGGIVYANDGSDIVYDASGTVDPQFISVVLPKEV